MAAASLRVPAVAEFPRNISRRELERSQTAIRKGIDNTIPDELLPNAVRLAEFLQTLRDRLSRVLLREAAIILSSGFRCYELNRAIGGSTTSAHMKALAADIYVPGLSPRKLAEYISILMSDYDQVIVEFDRWVHLGLSESDVEPRREQLTAMRREGNVVYLRGFDSV